MAERIEMMGGARRSKVTGRKVDMPSKAIFRRLEKVSEWNRLCRMLRESTPITLEKEGPADA